MKFKIIVVAGIIGLMVSCGTDVKKEDAPITAPEEIKEEVVVDPLQNKGVGPISNITLGKIDQAKAAQGEIIFNEKCAACHKVDNRFIGPALAGVTERRTPEWIMNIILNPEKMLAEDPIAKELYAEYLSPKPNQDVTEAEARFLLEYFRTLKVQ